MQNDGSMAVITTPDVPTRAALLAAGIHPYTVTTTTGIDAPQPVLDVWAPRQPTQSEFHTAMALRFQVSTTFPNAPSA